MDLSYLLTPFTTWFVTGILKFAINCLREKRPAFDLIGYGGMPSNHSAIVSSMVTLVGLKEGIDHPAFGVALTLAFIVLLDAGSLRRQVGRQAVMINRFIAVDAKHLKLRERMGHSGSEILTGIIVGITVSLVMVEFFK